MKIKNLKNWSTGIFHFTQNKFKRQTLKNYDQIEITILSQFKALMAIYFTKYILLFAND